MAFFSMCLIKLTAWSISSMMRCLAPRDLRYSWVYSGATHVTLKGQCHEIFDPFFICKNSTWAPYEQDNTVLQSLLSFAKSLFSKKINTVGVGNIATLSLNAKFI